MIPFKELGLRAEILATLEKIGFEVSTPIQGKVIPILLQDEQDCVGIASTGTGKTAAFALPILNNLDPAAKQPKALILCPTRELCMQISQEIERFASQLKGVKIATIYGGASTYKQILSLEKGAQIVVGTPGRVLDLVNRKHLKFSQIETVVLDEADEMLSMGFKEDLESILKAVPEIHRTLLFTATFSKAIKQIANTLMKDPIQVEVENKQKTTNNITYHYCSCFGEHKWLALRRYLDTLTEIHGIVFCKTRLDTQALADKLLAHGYAAEPIHGDLSQDAREHAMRRFRSKLTKLLIATDVAARGIDVKDLTHIFHYQLPEQPEVFVHRSGRTGRAGKSGITLAIVSPGEMRLLQRIEREQKIPFQLVKIPSHQEVLHTSLKLLIEKVVATGEAHRNASAPFQNLFHSVHKEDLITYILAKDGFVKNQDVQEPEDINREVKASSDKRDGFSRPKRDRGFRRSDRFGDKKPRSSEGGQSTWSNAPKERPAFSENKGKPARSFKDGFKKRSGPGSFKKGK